MSKKIEDKLKSERKIPVEVMEKLQHNRARILNQEIKQEGKVTKRSRKKALVFTFIAAAIACLIIWTQTPVGAAIEKALGISRDAGVATVESSEIPVNLELSSTQNGREIKLTKFVATKKKFAFDYQFTLDDEKLKELLQKKSSPERQFKKGAGDGQDIRLGLFVEGSTEDLFGGVMSESTFRVEGDTFYGSVVSTFDQEKIPEHAKLSLHIYQLSWVDTEELDKAYAEASKTGSPFGVENALEYIGDWQFAIDYEPLTQTAEPQVTQVNNIQNIKANSDALQTTVTFNIPVEAANEQELAFLDYGIEIYRNGVEVETPSYIFNPTNGEFNFSFDLSALDQTSVYKIQISKTDGMGNSLEEIGSFELQNK
ncbi:hypothetical protein [Enterococcus sp. BWR-S5]|uniref:hypothetical protein n=1 Tax=Enterococcus sp. BWR-S5 TaxID=2787714 RepID=UPI0019225568|nr:hypothetical protein [Enterococcus sp. BWR-S5]MBL1225471.1 hypothetical protein [Enterococcus sp. BWR-S5]